MSAPPLGAALHALARAQRRRLTELLAPHGLHPGQDLLLLLIWDTPGLRQADVANQLGIEPPTVTRMLQRLARGGLIERRADADDGRAHRVFPTPRSRLIEGEVRRAWASVDDQLVMMLGESGAAQLQRLATAASSGLDQSR
jgi:DNA-binding MarR family transcriptional regulator